MGKFRFDRLLTGTALALVFALGTPAMAEESQKDIDAAVPMPAPAELKQITPADVGNTGSVPAMKSSETSAPAAPRAEAPKVELPKAAETKPAEAKPADTAAAVDTVMGDKIRDALSGKSTRAFAKASDKSAADAFYSARKNAPMWVTSAGPTEKGKAAVA